MSTPNPVEMGNITTAKPTISIEYNATGSIYPNGGLIEGFVVINTTETINVKRISVRCLGHANINSASTPGLRMLIANSECYFDNTQKVALATHGDNPNSESTEITLQSGEHRYPFSYQMPMDIPASFEGTCGNVRYSCKAIVNASSSQPEGAAASTSTYQHERKFVVKSAVDISVIPNALSPVGATSSLKLRKFLCFTSNSIELDILFNQRAYVIGTDIEMKFNVKTTKPITLLEASLRTVILYFDIYQRCFGEIGEKLSDVESDCSSLGIKFNTQLNLNIPPTIPPTNLGRGCKIMKMTYYVQICICHSKTPGPNTKVFNFRIPVFLGTEMSPEMAENYRLDTQAVVPPPYTNITSEDNFRPEMLSDLTPVPRTPPPSYEAHEFPVPS